MVNSDTAQPKGLRPYLAGRERALWIWIAAAAIIDIAGAQHVYTQPSIAAAVLAALAVLSLAPLRHSGDTSRRIVALLPVAALVAAVVDIATWVPPNGGYNVPRLLILFGGGTALLLLNRAPAIAIVGAAFVLGTALRLIHMRHIAIEPANGDMLPLVQGAIQNLLAGLSPYRIYEMPWQVPLTYLPLTWLAYVPAYISGIDIRWINVVAELAILAALIWLAARRGNVRDSPALVLWSWMYLQPSVIHWDTGNTAPITWALLAVTFACVLGNSPRAGAAALGLTAAGTPLAAVFGPFVALHWLRQRGVQRLLPLLGGAAVVAAAVVAPFVIWSPEQFAFGVYGWFNDIGGWPRTKWLETDPPVWSIITGFSGEFWARGAEHWLKPIQAAIVLAVAVLYWRRGATADRLCTHAAAAYLGFMLFNPVLWPYLYNPALIVGLVGIAGYLALGPPTAPALEVLRRPARPTQVPGRKGDTETRSQGDKVTG